MASAQSQTDICNSALSRLGAATIINMTDNSREARACAVQYDSNRRSELRNRSWNFAVKRAVLAPDVTAPAFEYKYAFTLPADYLRLIWPMNDPYLDWKLEGEKILTNTFQSPYLGAGYQLPGATGPMLMVKYVADIEDPGLFDPMFYDLLCITLAIDICEVLTQSNTKKQALMAEAKEKLDAAAKAKCFEAAPQEPPDDTWWLVRNG
jgi:hypothetical protein